MEANDFTGKTVIPFYTSASSELGESGKLRCGKSVMLELIKEEIKGNGIDESLFLSANFESRAVDYVKSADLTYEYIRDFSQSHGEKVYLFSGELATYLAGRYIELKIYPFSFKEVMKILPGKPETEVFQIYLRQGGMPFLYQFPMDENSVRQYFSDI